MNRAYRVIVILGNARMNGQERANIEVYRALRSRGVEALFVTHKEWGHYQIQPALDSFGIPWTSLDYARHFTKRTATAEWPRNVGRIASGSLKLRRIIRRFDPTHVHVANPHYFLAVLPALATSRLPIVFRAGDAPTRHHRFYVWLWSHGIIPRVDHFVCISEFVRNRLVELGMDVSRSSIIYNHPPVRPPATAPLELPPPERRVVSYVGQLIPDKGVHLFIEAAARLLALHPDTDFLIAGDIHAENVYAHQMIGWVKSHDLQDRIRFLGRVEDIPGLFARSAVHVCPSLCEDAAPNVVMEAKRASVPSVVFARGGLPEQVRVPDEGRVCIDLTSAALVRDIHDLLVMDAAEHGLMRQAVRASLDRLGATEETFVSRWLNVLDIAARTAA